MTAAAAHVSLAFADDPPHEAAYSTDSLFESRPWARREWESKVGYCLGNAVAGASEERL
jgi:hypothetical protein